LLVGVLINTCSRDVHDATAIPEKAEIFPDYSGITIPVNIAPLNFRILENGEAFYVRMHNSQGYSINIRSKSGKIIIPFKKWKRLLQTETEKTFMIDVFARQNNRWKQFEQIKNTVSPDSVDSYVAYRLIEPGFETWNKMGIYQRCLEDFTEKPLMINSLSDNNCMNCHSFCLNNPETMLFHTRAKHGGTIIKRKGNIVKVDTKTDSTFSSGVYPSWHPGGRYVAFSINRVVQTFHASPYRKVEVIDTISDLILYDVETNTVIKSPVIASPDRFETSPCWSPDGKFLYYCSALKHNYRDYKGIRYDLMRVPFEVKSGKFGLPDAVIMASQMGFSIAFPRISPDGKYLMFCKTAYGYFTIWHDDSDLCLLDLQTGKISKPEVNSNRTESFHCWSSNSRWIIFSSRRIDGWYTRLYIAYLDGSGKARKAFLLPQKDPGYNDMLLKSFNVPEFITSKVKLNPRVLSEHILSDPENSAFIISE
jgi:hypothetical protein